MVFVCHIIQGSSCAVDGGSCTFKTSKSSWICHHRFYVHFQCSIISHPLRGKLLVLPSY